MRKSDINGPMTEFETHTRDDADDQLLSRKREDEVREIFNRLGIKDNSPYPGPHETVKRFNKPTALRYEGIIFSTSSSTKSE